MKTTTKLLLLIALLAMGCTPVAAQEKKDTINWGEASQFMSTGSGLWYYDMGRSDTISVTAYCLINADKLKFKWLKLYGLSGLNNPSINFNGFMIYRVYLMPDRKTPVTFKVIYSVDNK